MNRRKLSLSLGLLALSPWAARAQPSAYPSRPVSLVVPYELSSMRSRERPHLKSGHLVRFSTGLESPEVLIRDLQQALLSHLPV